ncbi:helix-turn-helix transcriptional regulator [Natronosporangium hydrolyticum]|uniref:Helix-turn-helix transcriptional regulator n=2 Tax=Natronosporangium hydrolyticum TaxID=2811111 RepID=A0A895YP83_9ACTN|nr:helix-turn-helix transcriptional regulator [Natronosporangium hydrolyticum]
MGVTTVRTAVTDAEVMARLTEAPAELILVDTSISRPDTVGFTKRVLTLVPNAMLVLLGHEEPQVAAAAVAAGARGLIRGGDNDLAGTVAKVLLLIGNPRRPQSADGARTGGTGSPAGPAGSGAHHDGGEIDGGGRSGSGAQPPAVAGERPAGGDRPDGTRASGPPGAAADGARLAAAGGDEPGLGRPGAPSRPAVPEAGAGRPAAERAVASAPPGAPAGPAMVPAQRDDAAAAPEVRRATLTERELQVLRGMAEGKSNAEIGRELFVSEDTVKTHARRLFRKLRARDRAHAVAVGFRAGALR